MSKAFEKGEKVYARNFGTSTGQKWIPGEIEEVTGPVSVMVKLGDRIVRHHADHVQRRVENEVAAQPNQLEHKAELEDSISDVVIRPFPTSPNSPGAESTNSGPAESPISTDTTEPVPAQRGENTNADPIIEARETRKTYPKRNRKSPDWYRHHVK